MSKSIFVLMVILSLIFTLSSSLLDALYRKSLLGEGGFPFRFSSGASFLGESSTNYFILLLDILFWFIVVFLLWKIIFKIFRKR